MTSATMEEAVSPEMTASDREMWCEEIERRCGVYFSETRMYALRSALLRGMRRHGMDNYRDYYRLVWRSAAEWNALLEAVLNRETCFFRHPPSFDALRDLLPRLAAARSRGEALALWSAGCSSGEEAYSMAFAAEEAWRPGLGRCAVLGSDLSAEAIETARRARYATRAAGDLPAAWRARYFVDEGDGLAVNGEIRARVRFERFNFIDVSTYPGTPQDVIFCQNVLIYFREPLRLRVAATLGEHLRPGGYLVPGPGELAGVRLPGMECRRVGPVTVWCRV